MKAYHYLIKGPIITEKTHSLREVANKLTFRVADMAEAALRRWQPGWRRWPWEQIQAAACASRLHSVG